MHESGPTHRCLGEHAVIVHAIAASTRRGEHAVVVIRLHALADSATTMPSKTSNAIHSTGGAYIDPSLLPHTGSSSPPSFQLSTTLWQAVHTNVLVHPNARTAPTHHRTRPSRGQDASGASARYRVAALLNFVRVLKHDAGHPWQLRRVFLVPFGCAVLRVLVASGVVVCLQGWTCGASTAWQGYVRSWLASTASSVSADASPNHSTSG